MNTKMSNDSYIWNLNNPNVPQTTLTPASPLCTMVFNPKTYDIVGGCYNGSVAFFDLRSGKSSGSAEPVARSILEKSHHDPVYDVFPIISKTNSEYVSTSTDG